MSEQNPAEVREGNVAPVAPAAAPGGTATAEPQGSVTREEVHALLASLGNTLRQDLSNIVRDALKPQPAKATQPRPVPRQGHRPARNPNIADVPSASKAKIDLTKTVGEKDPDGTFHSPDVDVEINPDNPQPPDSLGTITPMQAGDADVVCGKEGDGTAGGQIPHLTKWTFKPTVSLQEFASNQTNGFKRRVCGVRTASGTLEGKWSRTNSIYNLFKEGDNVTIVLTITAGITISVPALIKGMSIEVDINDNAIVSWSADFESDGEYTFSG